MILIDIHKPNRDNSLPTHSTIETEVDRWNHCSLSYYFFRSCIKLKQSKNYLEWGRNVVSSTTRSR